MMCRFRIAAFAAVVAAAICGSAAPDAEEDARFLEGLRQRRLYTLAASFCRERLARPEVSTREAARLTTQLIRCHLGQALNANPQDREESWQEAEQVAAAFVQRHPDTAWSLLVRVQDALTHLTRGQLLQQEAELARQSPAAMEPALDALRQASRELEQLQGRLAAAIPASHRNQDPDEPDAEALLALQHQVRYHLARACRIRGSCYPPASRDRVALLSQAVEVADQALRQLTDQDPLGVQLMLERAIAQRLSGNMEAASSTLKALFQRELSESEGDALAAEVARWYLARGQPAEALKHLDRTRATRRSPAADLDFAYLETLLAEYRQASAAEDPSAADSWRKQAVAAVGVIQKKHGAYWARRADLALIGTLGSLSGVEDVPVLVRAGDDLYRKGQWEDAVAAYEQAAAAADGAGDEDQAFRLRYKAALVEQSRGLHAAAAERLSRLARGSRSHPDAAAAQLLAAWNLAQLGGEPPESLERYETTLRTLIADWPDNPSADTGRSWLGRLCQSRGQWREAIQAFGTIRGGGPQEDEAVEAAAACWERLLEQETGDPAAAASLAEQAAGFFEQRISGPLQGAAPWQPGDRRCAMHAANLRLRFQPDGYAAAERVLRAAADGPPPPPEDWRNRARALLVVALSGQADQAELAEAELAEIGGAEPEQLLSVLTSINQLASAASPAHREDLAELRLQIVQRLMPVREELAPAARLTLDCTRAEALRDSGQREAAEQCFADLARARPDDQSVQEAYAEILLDASDPATVTKALEQWRRVAGRCRPRTEAWYRARHAIAEALIKLGRTKEAAERIRYLQITPPGLEGTAWEEPFQRLLDQCPDDNLSRRR